MYLPDIFKSFIEKHGAIADAHRQVGDLCAEAGPIDAKSQHLIQLGVSIGAGSKGAVRSHARRAIDNGASPEEVAQTVLLSMTIVGFPAMIAAFGWVQELLTARED